MRLINTRTFAIRDYGAQQPPHYVILSHLWGEDEVTFQDMADLGAARQKKGFSKIAECCRQAVRDRFEWAWVDTCCIDKTSSAELSESINAMFKWYERAMKCYAFLADVDVAPGKALNAALDDHPGTWDAPREGPPGPATVFQQSRWWRRGWTLQELIAPHDVEFYNCRWELLTTKRACKRFIAHNFGIPWWILDRSWPLTSVCVAERIAWAAKRDTTREEDMAYALLGILDVNMPLLYGEGGARAFLRLQERTLAAYEDYSLLFWHPVWSDRAVVFWGLKDPEAPFIWAAPALGMLASHPRNFGTEHSTWKPWSRAKPVKIGLGEPPLVTARGLRLSLFVRAVGQHDLDGASPLSQALQAFVRELRRLQPQTYRRLADWLEPGGDGPPAGRVYLAVLPIATTESARLLPCILLLDVCAYAAFGTRVLELDSFADGAGSGPFLKLDPFFYRMPLADLSGSQDWKLRSCYVMASTEPGFGSTYGLNVSRPGRIEWGPAGYPAEFWTWRTPIPYGIRQVPFEASGAPGEYFPKRFRWCLHLEPSGPFPGCLISIAVDPPSYWIHFRAADVVNTEAESKSFAEMNLNGKWARTGAGAGPVAEHRFEFEGGSLVMTVTTYGPYPRAGWRVILGFTGTEESDSTAAT